MFLWFVQPTPIPAHSWAGCGSGGYTPAAPREIAQPGRAVKGKPPQAAGRSAPLTARSRLCRDNGGDGGYTRQSSGMDERKALGTKCLKDSLL